MRRKNLKTWLITENGGGLMDIYEIINQARKEGRKKLLEHEVYAILQKFELPVPKFGLATTPEEAADIASKIGFPVVLKIVSPDIIHKSDVGGVILDIKSTDEALDAFNKIRKNVSERAPKARVAGILIQEMVPQGLEVIVGGTRDPTFGPVVMFGLGGIFVEVIRDVSFKVVPVTEYDAEQMLKEIKAGKILDGYRNMPPRDKKALVDIILKTSKLLDTVDEIQDVDLNPIMSYEVGRGAKIADARIILR